MAIFTSRSPEETIALGGEWGRAAMEGQVIAVAGELGAGKTQLARGIARGLGFTGRVHSPTFTLLNEYPGGRLTFFHLDLYRLENASQVVAAGLEEYFSPSGITLVEWPERWFGDLKRHAALRKSGKADPFPARLRLVSIDTLSEMERRIEYEDAGD